MGDSLLLECIYSRQGLGAFIAQANEERSGCLGFFAVLKCGTSVQMTTTPPLTEAELPALYSQYYPRSSVDFEALEEEASRVNKPWAAFYRWVDGTNNQGHYMAKPGEKVLDIGCGYCLSLLEMRAKGVECWGVEADPNVKVIADRYGLPVHIGNIYDVPFPEMTFDLIVLNQVIEHVPDPRAMLEAVRARLAPGGRVALAFPNPGSFYRHLWKDRWINWHIPYHQNHFNRGSFSRLALLAGFSVTSICTITPNLWTVLQLRMAAERRQEGLASSTWSHSDEADSSVTVPAKPPEKVQKFTLMRKIRNVLVSRLVRMTGLGIGIGNRIVDTVGLGDSFLVVLKPSKR